MPPAGPDIRILVHSSLLPQAFLPSPRLLAFPPRGIHVGMYMTSLPISPSSTTWPPIESRIDDTRRWKECYARLLSNPILRPCM